MSRNHLIRRGLNKLSDAIDTALGNDPTENLTDEASAGDGGLTGPELAAAQAREVDDFSDLDDLGSDLPPRSYVNPDDNADTHDERPAAATARSATPPAQLDGLAKQYVLKGYESLQRTPSAAISDNYRGQLLHFRDTVNLCHKAGIKSLGKLTAAVVGSLAIDQRGKIDAISFLRQIMRQAVWQASVDVARYRRLEAKNRRTFGEEDETREAPYGMEGMSDHSDAIQGVAGSSEAVEWNEADVISALVEVNGWLSAFADTLCDDANDRLYFGLESGLSYIDKPGLMAGSWVGVFDPDEAIDIQLIKNQESQARRDAERTARRRAQLAALAAVLDA